MLTWCLSMTSQKREIEGAVGMPSNISVVAPFASGP
jgi:hypothetical protein